MRVISGIAKGRTLKSPGSATRPITDRVKESLFNILGARVIDANVLDLFAGAGSVGIEALSRGARHATFVELDRDALRAIRENLELTRLADRASIVRKDVFKFIRREGVTPAPALRSASGAIVASTFAGLSVNSAKQSLNSNNEIASTQNALPATLAPHASAGVTRYDLIYLAPPQYRELWSETLETLDGRGLLSERGMIVAQIHPKEFRALAFEEFRLSDQRKYGSTMLCFYSVISKH